MSEEAKQCSGLSTETEWRLRTTAAQVSTALAADP